MQSKKSRSYAEIVEESSTIDDISAMECQQYDFITLQNATENFSYANKIGVGGYGVVYKGKLQNGQEIVVMRLSKYLEQDNQVFKNEVVLLANLQHRNLVRLLGFCMEGREMILVYEFVPNGGLDQFLFDPIKCGYLDWGRRYKIIERIGRGLVYLHENSRLRIIHRNLQTSNILLDANLNPKIADFGLAWLNALDETHCEDRGVVGTLGYMAPEVSRGLFSVKSDVYSYGVLVLEIISGQKNLNYQNGEPMTNLLSYAWTHWKKGSSLHVIEPMLRGISSPVPDIIKCIHIALLCVQENDIDRPTMGEVLQMLSNLSMSLPVPLAPGFFLDSSINSESSSQFTKNEMSIGDEDNSSLQYNPKSRRCSLKCFGAYRYCNFMFSILRKMQKRKAKSYVKTMKETSTIDDINVMESVKYDFISIQNATNNFSEANKIGRGSFGPVYKGKLQNGQEVAVKRLSKYSRQGNREFKNEVALLAKLQHRNLVRLLGFCLERKEMLLVYEFVPNGNLNLYLFDPVKRGYLDWGRRYKIIENIGKGLVYLHEDSRLRIVLRCLSASDVLLDSDLNPKISDFGMAWLFTLDQTHSSTNRIVGTCGYLAPEYAMHGEISVKTDVFSFGMLVLEIISGQKFDILNHAWTHWKGGSASNVIDPMLRGISSHMDDITKCIHIALLCVQENVADRPTMTEVLQMLSNLSNNLPVPSIPAYFNDSNINTEDSQDSINGTSINDGEYPK